MNSTFTTIPRESNNDLDFRTMDMSKEVEGVSKTLKSITDMSNRIPSMIMLFRKEQIRKTAEDEQAWLRELDGYEEQIKLLEQKLVEKQASCVSIRKQMEQADKELLEIDRKRDEECERVTEEYIAVTEKHSDIRKEYYSVSEDFSQRVKNLKIVFPLVKYVEESHIFLCPEGKKCADRTGPDTCNLWECPMILKESV